MEGFESTTVNHGGGRGMGKHCAIRQDFLAMSNHRRFSPVLSYGRHRPAKSTIVPSYRRKPSHLQVQAAVACSAPYDGVGAAGAPHI